MYLVERTNEEEEEQTLHPVKVERVPGADFVDPSSIRLAGDTGYCGALLVWLDSWDMND